MNDITALEQLRAELANPAIGSKDHLRKIALSLVEALESAQKSNAFLKDQLSELANFNPDWDKLEASYESWREIAAELLAAKGRIAELEGRAIKFPPKVERDDSDGYWMLKGQRVSAANAAYYNEALKDVALALFAAGIKCEVKGGDQ